MKINNINWFTWKQQAKRRGVGALRAAGYHIQSSPWGARTIMNLSFSHARTHIHIHIQTAGLRCFLWPPSRSSPVPTAHINYPRQQSALSCVGCAANERLQNMTPVVRLMTKMLVCSITSPLQGKSINFSVILFIPKDQLSLSQSTFFFFFFSALW